MDFAAVWEQFKSIVGLDEPHAARTVAKAIQIIVVSLLALWIGNSVGGRIRQTAKQGRLSADVAALASRAAAIGVLAAGAAIVLAILGVNPTAIAALLGATTVAASLAFQDVGRAIVNGVYILVERPFKTGDRIRVDTAEGRVEEIGIRLTRLRTDAGHFLVVPNSLVFASVVEQTSVEQLDRQQFLIAGIVLPIQDIETAIVETLRGAPHLSHRQPLIAITQSSSEGTTVELTVEHDLGHRIDGQVFAQLRERFPEATISTLPPAPAS